MVEDEAVGADLLGHGAAVAVIVLVALLVVGVVAIIGGALEVLGGCRACRGTKCLVRQEEQVMVEGLWW